MKHSEQSASRRNFLQNTGVALAGVGLVAVGSSPVHAARNANGVGKGDIGVLQGALALEHEGIAAYMIAGASGLLTPDVLKIALVFLGHHQGHRDALANLIIKAGGKPVEQKTDAEYVAALNLGELKSQGDVVALATRLEQGAANAYVGQISAIKDRSTAKLFAQLASDEAVHWAVLNNALGNAVPSQTFLFG
ncbi:MAG: ferritin-like domain-containing protein [Sphingorhabdus sp.]|uniref:ferritin-like domain-containing protein n=1 Tax=Sphingorhabdus sp. TaxID=1902408 RepID=UPI0038FCE91E